MIVICTRCQAKFKVADEKVGPRGAKVRCSRCQTVFLVHKDLGTMPVSPAPSAAVPPARPVPDVDLEARTPPPRPAAPVARPIAPADPFAAAADPFAAAAAPDPFAALADDPFAPRAGPLPTFVGPRPDADPLGALAAPRTVPDPSGVGEPFAADARAADPFASGATDLFAPRAGDPFAPGAADPFAPPASGDPFAPAASSPSHPRAPAAAPSRVAPGGAPADPFAAIGDPFAVPITPRPAPSLPVTDLSALLGAPAAATSPQSAAAPPVPSFELAAAPGLPKAAARPAAAPTELDFSGDFDFSEPAPAAGGTGPGADLALEDRTTPGPDRALRAAPAPSAAELPAPDEGLPLPDSSGAEAGFADPGEVSFYSEGDAPLALATEATAGPMPAAAPERAPAAPPARPTAAPPSARGAATRPAEDAATADAIAAGVKRIPGGRGDRLRAVAVNAVALAALLLVALAFRVVWRGEGTLGGGALRPSAVLGALGRDGAAAATFAPKAMTSGLYDREKAPPVLFVRGELVSRAPAPVRSVAVGVEIVRGGKVLARGSALAGAVPTPEELYLTGDDAALEAFAAALRARAPAEIRPGDRVPFLVAIGDAPADLSGAAVHVEAVPEGASR